MGKGRARYTPHKRYFIMFVRSIPCCSCFFDLVSKSCHKATTLNCVPQGAQFPSFEMSLMLAASKELLVFCDSGCKKRYKVVTFN